LHQVGVLFDLYYDARKHKSNSFSESLSIQLGLRHFIITDTKSTAAMMPSVFRPLSTFTIHFSMVHLTVTLAPN